MRCLYWGVHLTTSLCDQSSYTLGHKMCLPGGRVRLTFCLKGSQPASHVTKYQPVRLWVGQIVGGRRTVSLTTLGPCQGSQHSHLFPLGSELPDQGQATDTNELCSPLYTTGTTFRDHLQFFYLYHLITYSCTKCREMLYTLFSLHTNLLISFHHKSDVLLHQGTTFKELLLSSQTRNAMEKKSD